MRSVPEWIASHPDQQVPPRVRVRVFDRHEGRCHKCTRKVMAGEQWTCEHLVALINGGKNREANLRITCCLCLPQKNAEDVAEKAKVYAVRSKHLGVKRVSPRPFPGSKRSGWRKKVNGTVERRAT